MKKLTFVAASALMATTAFAGDHSINATGRMSWVNLNRDVKKTSKPSDSRIKAEVADLVFAGKLTGNTTYTLGLNLAQSNATADKDVATKFIDTVYVTRTLAEGLTLDVGQRPLLGGGFEVTHGTADQYVTSNYWNTVDTTGAQFGLTLTKEFMGHSLMAQVSNGNKDRVISVNSNEVESQSRYGYAFEWMGSYANGMVKSNVGYTVVPSTTSKQSTNLLGAGLQFNLSKMVVEADYGVVTSVKAATGNKDKETTSMTAVLAYTGMETLTPFAKVISQEEKQAADGSKSDKVMTIAVGFEYKESKADNIRYHAAYASEGHTPTGGTKYTNSTIMVGAKFDANIL